MALTSSPFALKNLGLEAEQLRQAVSSVVPNGGGLVQSGDFPVTQTTTPSLGVSVGVGRAWIPGTNVSNLAGQAYSTQAQYFILNDSAVTVNLSTADSSNPRIDLVYLGMQDKFYGGAADQPVLGVIKGVAAPTPVAPTLAGAGIANAIPLVNVAVAANATSVLNANITTLQNQIISPQPAFIHAEFTCVPSIPQNNLYNLGPLTLDTSNSNGSGIITSPSQGVIQLATPGIYAMSVALVNFNVSASGTGSYMLLQTPDTAHTYARSNMPAGTLGLTTESPNVYVPTPNFQVAAQVIQTFTATLSAACRVRVTKIR